MRVLYVVGKGRSGSTVLDNVLGQVPGVFSSGEMFRLWDWGFGKRYLCGCGQPVPECAVWSRVRARLADVDTADAREVYARMISWKQVPRLLRTGLDDWWPLLEEYRAIAGRVHEAIGEVTGARVVIDSGKLPFEPGALGLVPGVDPYVLHLVRDPRAVAHSWQGAKEWTDRPGHELMPRYGPVHSGLSWTVRNGLARALERRVVPGRFRTLRYEDLMADPASEVASLLEWVGEDPATSPVAPGGAVTLSPTHTVGGNPDRLETGEIRLRPHEGWRDDVAPTTRLLTTALALPLLRRLGYRWRVAEQRRGSPPAATGDGRPRLLVTASTYPGRPDDGTPAFVADLAAEEARRFDTLVVVPAVPGAARREEHDGMVVERFRYFPRRWEDLAHGAIFENLRARPSRWLQLVPFLVAEALALRRAVRRFGPQMAHVHWLVPQGAVLRLVAPRLPVVATTLGGDLYVFDGPLWRPLLRWVVKGARHVTAQNHEMLDRLVDLGATEARAHWLPVPVDRRAFDLDDPPARERGRLVFVGRLVEKKGVAVLLEALARLEHEEWQLEVIGDGPLRAELEERAGRFGDRVRFSGQLGRSAISRCLLASQIVVVPSVPARSGDQDGLPVALLEGMAAGCAPVASDLPGIDQAVEPDRSGVLVPPGDVAALADALGRLLADPARTAELGAAAARRSEQFGVDAIGERFCALLAEAAGVSPRPTPPGRRTG